MIKVFIDEVEENLTLQDNNVKFVTRLAILQQNAAQN